MSKRIVRITLSVLIAVSATAAPARAQEPEPAAPAATDGGVTALSPGLRELFRLEMASLQGAMLQLLPAVVSGDWEAVASVAQRIRSGFVLDQQLTAAQREELRRALPVGFLERDAEFHEVAAGLEAAAHERREDLVPFYVYKLTEGCVGCHARHARGRFPAFASAHAPAAHAH